MKLKILIALPLLLMSLIGCTTVNVNEMRLTETDIDPSTEKIVVLGRHHSPEFETEPALVACIGDRLERGIDGLDVLPAPQFRDVMYPWFEPRTAPLQLEKFGTMLEEPRVRDTLTDMGVRYIVWITGATEQINEAGSLACTFGPGGGGCFGFGTWENESTYEATIWDFNNLAESGRISTDARGTSYLPAIIIPIPIIARVQSNACEGMGEQLMAFLSPVAES
jgi:hypothetical protein